MPLSQEEGMTSSTFKLDMTMMLTIHDAFRRELARIATITANTTDDPRHTARCRCSSASP